VNDLERAAAILRQHGSPQRLRKFDQALAFVREREGGLANIPGDRGGLTKFGISSRSYPRLNIRALTWDQARTIYFADFWLKASCHLYPYPLAVAVFGYAVHSGVSQAVRTLQREIRTKPDGKVGDKTRAALAAALRARGSVNVATGVMLRRVDFLAARFKRGVFPLAWLRNYWRRIVLLEHELHRS
jgi:lysozyme family protein